MPERFSPRAHGLLAINIAAVIFGTAALYGKLEVAPVWITAMRAGFGVLALLVLGGLSRSLLRLPVQAWGLLGISGALLACHWLTFFISVQLSGVAVGTLTFATFPLFTVTVEAAARRRLPGLTELLAAIAIILAVALLLQPDSSGNDSLAGTLAGLVSALAYAFFWRVTQRIQQPLPAASLSLIQNGVVFLLLLPALFYAAPAPADAKSWLALSALGIINTAVLLLLYLYALQRISASSCSGFIALEPVYAISFAALLFGDPVTPWILASMALIIGASLILLRVEQKTQPLAAPNTADPA